MKKETLIAIIFGILFGAVVATVLVVSSPKNDGATKKTTVPTNTTISITPAPVHEMAELVVTKPEEGTQVGENTIKIEAKVGKESLVLIQSPLKSVAAKADSDIYLTDFPLSLGENTILVTVFSKDQPATPQEKTLHVYYFDDTP